MRTEYGQMYEKKKGYCILRDKVVLWQKYICVHTKDT